MPTIDTPTAEGATNVLLNQRSLDPPYFRQQVGIQGDENPGKALGFDANGRLGAIPIGESINVKSFGAIGDGIADDAPAIQAALDFCHANGGGTVFAPGGTYLLASTIIWPSTATPFFNGNNITLRGAGCGYGYGSNATVHTVFLASGLFIAFDLCISGAVTDCTYNHLVDFSIDGNLTTQYGIRCPSGNIIERVRVHRCTAAGALLDNFINSTRIIRCAFTNNYGWGLKVTGASSTAFSVTDSTINSNNTGGVLLEAGVGVRFANCVIESNGGTGLKIHRPDTHDGAFGNFVFDNCWLEANASADPYYSLVIDSQTRSEANAPWQIVFRNCRFGITDPAKYMQIMCAKWVTFDRCNFDYATAVDAIVLGPEARFVVWKNSRQAGGNQTGLSTAQLDAAVAAGTSCWYEDADYLATPTLVGGNAADGDLVLRGTTHATKTNSNVTLQDTGGNVMVGGPAPVVGRLQVLADAGSAWALAVKNPNTTSHGLLLDAGTGVGDNCVYIRDKAGGSVYLLIRGDGFVGVGTAVPSASLLTINGNAEFPVVGNGVILKSPDGTRYRIQVANGGALSTTPA